MPSVCLIGMPGVGKSKIGEAMADILGCAFIDTDRIIKRQFHKPLQEILEDIGSERFLECENAALEGIVPGGDVVISPGGSAVFCERGMAHIASFCTIIYLADTFENIERRITNLNTRGIVGLSDLGGLDEVFEQRDPLYRRWAHHVFWLPQGFPYQPSVVTVAQRLVEVLNEI